MGSGLPSFFLGRPEADSSATRNMTRQSCLIHSCVACSWSVQRRGCACNVMCMWRRCEVSLWRVWTSSDLITPAPGHAHPPTRYIVKTTWIYHFTLHALCQTKVYNTNTKYWCRWQLSTWSKSATRRLSTHITWWMMIGRHFTERLWVRTLVTLCFRHKEQIQLHLKWFYWVYTWTNTIEGEEGTVHTTLVVLLCTSTTGQ